MEIFKKYWWVIILGLILRIVIAGFSYHPDVKTPALSSAVVFREGTLDFYSHSKDFAPQEVLDDLPLSYFINLPFHLILRPFVSTQVEDTFFLHQNTLFGNPNLWFYLIYTKLPMIIFDLALGILIAVSVSINFRKKALYLWLFNPFTLWVTAAIGQADVYPAFFILLTYFLIKRNQLNWAALSLGFGGAIKSAPFLLIPFLVGLGKNWKERMIILFITTIPYLITVTPYLWIKEFRRGALLAPQFSKSLYANLSLSGGEQILIVPAILIFLYLLFFAKKRDGLDFLKFSITTLLMILTFTHFHIQWFLWVLPLLILWLLQNWNLGIKLSIVGLVVSLLMMIFLFESSLQLKLFAPLIPSFDNNLGLKEILSDQQGIFIRSVAASIFAAANLFLVWKILGEDK